MIRSIVTGWLALGFFSAVQAAIVVTSEEQGAVSQQYFEDGDFVLMQSGQPAFGADASGNCWFVERDRLVFDQCTQMLDSMSSMRDQAMAGMSSGDRAMMEQMMGMQRNVAVNVRASGKRTIAGYEAECHMIGDSHEVCVSAGLLDEIKNEMGDSRFSEMVQRFQKSGAEMVGNDSQLSALQDLFERGYPMLNMRKTGGMPGMNQSMMQFIPEAQRAQIMQQMAASGMPQQEQGSRVVSVEKGVSMPSVDLSGYQRMTFQQFMQQTMGQMPAMPR